MINVFTSFFQGSRQVQLNEWALAEQTPQHMHHLIIEVNGVLGPKREHCKGGIKKGECVRGLSHDKELMMKDLTVQ